MTVIALHIVIIVMIDVLVLMQIIVIPQLPLKRVEKMEMTSAITMKLEVNA